MARHSRIPGFADGRASKNITDSEYNECYGKTIHYQNRLLEKPIGVEDSSVEGSC